MAEKSGKKKTKKSTKASGDPSVLGNLRSTRPTRIGGERRAPTSPKPRPAKPKAAAMRPPATPPPAPEAPRDGRPSGPEIVTTAVQAAGELAQIGFTVGRQVLKRATGRIPRP
jgi:hypothetical protein